MGNLNTGPPDLEDNYEGGIVQHLDPCITFLTADTRREDERKTEDHSQCTCRNIVIQKKDTFKRKTK